MQVTFYSCLFRPGIRSTDRFSPSTCESINNGEFNLIARLKELTIKTPGYAFVIYLQYETTSPLRKIQVGWFIPHDEDFLVKHYVSTTGELRTLDLPPVAVHSDRILETQLETEHYLKANCRLWAQTRPGSIRGLVVERECKHYEFFFVALQILFGATLKTGTPWVVGERKLSIKPVEDPGHRLDKKHVMPRMVVAQLEEMLTNVLRNRQSQFFEHWHMLRCSGIREDLEACLLVFSQVVDITTNVLRDRRRRAQDNIAHFPNDPEFEDHILETIDTMREDMRECGVQLLCDCDELICDCEVEMAGE